MNDYSSQTAPDWLSWICNSKDVQQLQQKYDVWAKSYDADVDKAWRYMTHNAAAALEKALPMKEASILDAGAGTGLVGEALAQRGYTNLTAVDLSEEMLVLARKKQVYKALRQCNLEEAQAFDNQERFDAIISVGVFAYAHAGVDVLHNLFRLLQQEGIFVFTLRGEYRDEMQGALDKLPWSLISQEQFNVYGNDIIYVLTFKR